MIKIVDGSNLNFHELNYFLELFEQPGLESCSSKLFNSRTFPNI